MPLAPGELDDPYAAPLEVLRPWTPEGTAIPAERVAKVLSRPKVVDTGEGAGARRVWAFPLLGAAYETPATVFRGKAGPNAVEFLDADGDGDPSGAADHVRFAGGAFHRVTPSRRLAAGERIVTYALERGKDGWVATLTPETKPADASDVEWTGLLAVGDFRNRVGLPPLVLARDRCFGSGKHATYIQLNPADGFGHDEIEGRPGFSPEGRLAAQLAVMERTAHPKLAVERLTRMMLHRTPFLGREAEPLGVGSVGTYLGPWESAFGSGYVVLWGAQALSSSEFPIVVPAPGQRDVPREALTEVPTPERYPNFYASPRGYPVSVSFTNETRRVVSIRLFDLERKPPRAVEGFFFSPQQPVHSTFAHNYATAFFTPKAPLDRNTTFAVEASVEGSEPTMLRWTFRTGRD